MKNGRPTIYSWEDIAHGYKNKKIIVHSGNLFISSFIKSCDQKLFSVKKKKIFPISNSDFIVTNTSV